MSYGFYFNDSYYAILGQLRSDLSRWRVVDRVCKLAFLGKEDVSGLNKKEINAFEFLKKKIERNGGNSGKLGENRNGATRESQDELSENIGTAGESQDELSENCNVATRGSQDELSENFGTAGESYTNYCGCYDFTNESHSESNNELSENFGGSSGKNNGNAKKGYNSVYENCDTAGNCIDVTLEGNSENCEIIDEKLKKGFEIIDEEENGSSEIVDGEVWKNFGGSSGTIGEVVSGNMDDDWDNVTIEKENFGGSDDINNNKVGENLGANWENGCIISENCSESNDSYCKVEKVNGEVFDEKIIEDQGATGGCGGIVGKKLKNNVGGAESEAGNVTKDLVFDKENCGTFNKDNQEVVGGGGDFVDNEGGANDSKTNLIPKENVKSKSPMAVTECLSHGMTFKRVYKNGQNRAKMDKNGQKRTKMGKNGRNLSKSVTYININPYKIKINNIKLKKLKEKEYKEKEKEESLAVESDIKHQTLESETETQILESESEKKTSSCGSSTENVTSASASGKVASESESEKEKVICESDGQVGTSDLVINSVEKAICENERESRTDDLTNERVGKAGDLIIRSDGKTDNSNFGTESGKKKFTFKNESKKETSSCGSSTENVDSASASGKVATSCENKSRGGVELSDIEKYILDNSLFVNAQAFYYFYKSKGWKVGGSRLVDWRAKCKEWHYRKLAEKNGEIEPYKTAPRNSGVPSKTPKDLFRCGSKRDYSGVDMSSMFCDLDKIEI